MMKKDNRYVVPVVSGVLGAGLGYGIARIMKKNVVVGGVAGVLLASTAYYFYHKSITPASNV